jgi:hypothetical protein
MVEVNKMKRNKNFFDLLKLMSEEWDREVREIKKEYWRELLKEK